MDNRLSAQDSASMHVPYVCCTMHRWIITESDDVRSSDNSEVCEELLEKLKNVRVMLNEDFVAIQQRILAEEEMEKKKNTTFQEIQQQKEELEEIAELESKINSCEAERVKLVQEFEEQVKKLSSNFPETGFTANDDLDSLTAKHYNLQCDLQQKRNHLQM